MGIQSLGIPSVNSKSGWFEICSTGNHNILIAYLHTGFFFFKNASCQRKFIIYCEEPSINQLVLILIYNYSQQPNKKQLLVLKDSTDF